LAKGGLGLFIPAEMLREQIAQAVPGMGEFRIERDGLPIGRFGLLVAVEMVREQKTQVVPGGGGFRIEINGSA